MRSSIVLILLLASTSCLTAQSLTFTTPQMLLPDAATDKAVDITNFKGRFFVTWKEAGGAGKPHVAYLGRHYDTTVSRIDHVLDGERTAFPPVLRVLGARIYLFWIGEKGELRYILNNSDTSFDLENVHRLDITGGRLSLGITSAAIGGRLLLASHAPDKQHLVYILVQPGMDGVFPSTPLQTVPAGTSTDYPFVVSLNDSLARFCWRGYKDQLVYCTDLNIVTHTWQTPLLLAEAKSRVAPAVYHIGNGERLFYIWRGPDNDKRLYYSTYRDATLPKKQTHLPAYFSTSLPVSICIVDDNNFILAFTGDDRKLYLSYFSNYNPATWMNDLLLPVKGSYTLKDIVLPGAHDAGMSVLSGVGGSQSGTINDCNTLTQTLDIAGQLGAGIRMFDLRVGTFNGRLYTKHCSSDCMSDAIGGGYGEKLSTLLDAIRNFLQKNKGEVVLLTFSHFCEKETPVAALADSIITRLGKDIIFQHNGRGVTATPLRQLAGKVILTFEHYRRPDGLIDSCTIAGHSGAPVNFRREYAATNDLNKFLSRQETFFRELPGGSGGNGLPGAVVGNNLPGKVAEGNLSGGVAGNEFSGGIAGNDLVRLDWQLTQDGGEAAMICNDFQSEKTNPLIGGAMLLTNVIRKHQSIIDLSIDGNKYLPVKLNEWISKGLVNKKNKPNILYVDVAGNWITDFCIDLNKSGLYQR